MTAKTRRSYTDECKRQAVRRVAAEGLTLTLADVARRLGANPGALRKWKTRFPPAPAAAPAGAAQDGVRRLREEVRQLRTERDTSKKATAFFAGQAA